MVSLISASGQKKPLVLNGGGGQRINESIASGEEKERRGEGEGGGGELESGGETTGRGEREGEEGGEGTTGYEEHELKGRIGRGKKNRKGKEE